MNCTITELCPNENYGMPGAYLNTGIHCKRKGCKTHVSQSGNKLVNHSKAEAVIGESVGARRSWKPGSAACLLELS